MDYTVHGILQARILEWVAFPKSPALQADSLPAEPKGKPKNTGVGSLSLLQWIFSTQELNWGLLHCRWILYQLSYEGSPGLVVSPKVKVKVKSLSCVRLFATPWAVAYQAPPSMGFSRQEYYSGLPFPSPGDLPDPGIKPWSPAFQSDALTPEPPGKE